MPKKKMKSTKQAEAEKMIDFTRRLLNVKKSEVDDLRAQQKTTAKRRG